MARSNKRIGAGAENRAADIYGTTRYPANTGGPLDLAPFAGMCVQVKAGGTIPLATIIDGLDTARRYANLNHGLGACHVEYRRKGAREHRKFIVFDAAEWAEWNGYGPSK